MSRRARRHVLALTGLAVALAAPPAAAAHALGQTYQLPVPLGLYLFGAGAAVAASFVATVVVARQDAPPAYPVHGLGPRLAGGTRLTLRFIGLAWWYGAIVAGLAAGDVSPLAGVLFWIGIWVGLPIVAVVIGNPWPSLSPFRTTYAALDWLGRRVGIPHLDLGLRYPDALGRWPVVVLLGVVVWAELILPGSDGPRVVATLLGSYTLLTLLGMVAFGPVAWLRHAELFEVYLGWFGRLGPLGRRSVSRQLCAKCGEACDAARCVDCPECAAAAGDGERRPEARPWFAGLTEVRRAGWSDAAVIVLALAAVSYDGLSETAAWVGPIEGLLDVFLPIVGPSLAFYVVDTAGLVLVALAFAAAFVIGVVVTRVVGGSGARRLPEAVGTYAATLLPIAGGYLVAHYLTLVIQGTLWLPQLVTDAGLTRPTTLIAPPLDWLPSAAVWYGSVAAIVIGHVAAVVRAHRIALRVAPHRAVATGLPLVALMVGYTVLSLWIIAQPIVIEPGVTQAAIGR